MGSGPACAPARAGPSWAGAGPRDGPGCRPEARHARRDGSRARGTTRVARPSRDADGPPPGRKAGDTVRASWIRARSGGLCGRPTGGWRGRTEPGPARSPRGLAIARPDRSARSRRRVRGEEGHPAGSTHRPRRRNARVARSDGRDGVVTMTRGAFARAVSEALWIAGFPVRVILVALIWCYRVVLGDWLGGQCRFSPSCSHYADQAIRGRGALVGSALALWRVLRCNPFNWGGVDPAPASRHGAAFRGVYEAVTHSPVEARR